MYKNLYILGMKLGFWCFIFLVLLMVLWDLSYLYLFGMFVPLFERWPYLIAAVVANAVSLFCAHKLSEYRDVEG